MSVPTDPGTSLQDNVKEPIRLSGATGLHQRFKNLYDMFVSAISADNIDLSDDYAWTGIHSHAGTSSFAGGITGDVAFDTNTLFVDSVNNRVYIGSASSAGPQQFQVIKSSVGSSVAAIVKNTDNTNTASHGILSAEVGGSSGGDPFGVFTVSGVSAWAFGLDNSDSDKFKISSGSVLGTNDRFTLDSTGNATLAGTCSATQYTSTVSTGTAPLVVSSTTKVTNLNADLLDGFSEAAFAKLADNETITGVWTPPSAGATPTANGFYRQGLVKAWGNVSISGPSYDGSYNMTGSPTSGGTGLITVTFDTDFSSNAYTVVANILDTNPGYVVVGSVSAGSCAFRIYNSAGALTDTDFRFLVIGTQ